MATTATSKERPLITTSFPGSYLHLSGKREDTGNEGPLVDLHYIKRHNDAASRNLKKDADEISSTFYGSFGLLTFAVFDAGSSGLISLWFTLSPHCTRPQRNFRMANSALRLIFQRSSRLLFSAGSTNGLIPSRGQEVNISLKRKLSSFLNSNPFVQASCHRATTSLVCTCRKVIQGDVRRTLCDKELGFRSYSSFEQGCTQV